jgi:hypothetical protein
MNTSKGKYIIIGIVALAAIGAAWYLFGMPGANVKKKHAGHLVLIHNAYVYKVWFSDESIGEIKFVRTPAGDFVPFDEETMQPNEVMAVGLVVHQNGTSVTSHKALYPWMDDNSREALRKTAQEICDHNKKSKPGMYFELTGGEYVSLTMYSRISLGRDKIETRECEPVSSAEADEQRIGLLKPKAFAIPYEYAEIDLAGVNKEELKEGKKLVLLGVDDAAFSTNGETVVLQKGEITSNTVSSNIYYNFENKFIAEGAPVFDKKGRLVAINSVFSSTTSALLMGKWISFTESADVITKRNFQQDIKQTMELYETMNEVDRARKALDSLLQGIDTIGQGIVSKVEEPWEN